MKKISEEDIFVNEKIWNGYNEDQIEEYINKVFNFYKYQHGFPYYNKSDEHKEHKFGVAKNYLNRKDILVDDIVRQTMHLLGTVNSYFPEMWEVRCHDQRTPKEVFDNDKLFRKAIRRRLKYGTYMSHSGIRKAIKRFPNTQAVSNFRPTASYGIYENYCSDNSTVWDMCSGWGGRFMGAMLSTKVDKYIGTDVEQYVFDGHTQMRDDFAHLRDIDLEMLNNDYPSEQVDLCFTSPPYFNTEKYGESENQSFRLYDTKEGWLNKFMGTMFERCEEVLKRGGHVIINIADVKDYPNLVDDVRDLGVLYGFEFIKELKLALSNITKGGFKYEPILVFKN